MPATYSKFFHPDQYWFRKLIRENHDAFREICDWPKATRMEKLVEAGFNKTMRARLELILEDVFGLQAHWQKTPEFHAIQKARLPAQVFTELTTWPNFFKLVAYRLLSNEKEKRQFLRYNVAVTLEIERRRGIKPSLGDILRSESLAWYSFPPLEDTKRGGSATQEKKLLFNSKKNRDILKREALACKRSPPLKDTVQGEGATQEKKAVWNRRNLTLLKLIYECGGTFSAKK